MVAGVGRGWMWERVLMMTVHFESRWLVLSVVKAGSYYLKGAKSKF